MRIPDKNTLLEQGRDYLSCSLDLLATLPSLPLSELVAGRTALILVDLVEGFAREGALASPRVEALLPDKLLHLHNICNIQLLFHITL